MGKFKLIYSVVISFLLCILSYINAMSPEQRIDKLKGDLNTSFIQSKNDNMFVITVTRTPSFRALTPIISDSEFKQILRLLYAICAHPGFVTGRRNINFPYCRQEDVVLGMEKNITGTVINNVDLVISNIEKYFTRRNMKNAHKLVVFNEMFFSQEEPLTFEQKNFIEDKLLDLSRASKYGIFYPNFLYTEVKQRKGCDVYADLLAMGKHAGIHGLDTIRKEVQRVIPQWGNRERAEFTNMFFEKEVKPLQEGAKRIVSTISNDDTLVSQEYLFNETYAIYDGTPLTKTAKFGYWRESDSKISEGCIYVPGSGYAEGLATNSQKAIQQNVLLTDISNDICVDLNIRKNRMSHTFDFPAMGDDSCLHIIQSNCIEPFYNDTNWNNLPTMRGIIHADPYYKFSKACLPYVKEDRNLGKVFCQEQRFSVDFAESNCTINVLEI